MPIGTQPRVLSTLAAAAAAISFAACGSSSSAVSPTAASPPTSSAAGAQTPASTRKRAVIGFEGMPIESGSLIAPAASTGTAPVHGIVCGSHEQLAYHIHAHLSVAVNGQPRSLPAGIGIPGSQTVATSQLGPVAAGGRCIYWLHTHAPDGVIHIESPTHRIYTLGDFFDEWRQPLSAMRVGEAHGAVSALVDGRPWRGSVRAIPLDRHAVIQLSVGHPVRPSQPVSWSSTGL